MRGWTQLFSGREAARYQAEGLVAANRHLIALIREEIARFDRNPPCDAAEWPTWRTPEPWRTTALENLTEAQVAMERASLRLDRDGMSTIRGWALSLVHLSKNLDFDTRWAGPDRASRLAGAISAVVSAAGAILDG